MSRSSWCRLDPTNDFICCKKCKYNLLTDRPHIGPGWMWPSRGVSWMCRHFNRSWSPPKQFGNLPIIWFASELYNAMQWVIIRYIQYGTVWYSFGGCADISIGVDLPPANLVASISYDSLLNCTMQCSGSRYNPYNMATYGMQQYLRFFRYHNQPA